MGKVFYAPDYRHIRAELSGSLPEIVAMAEREASKLKRLPDRKLYSHIGRTLFSHEPRLLPIHQVCAGWTVIDTVEQKAGLLLATDGGLHLYTRVLSEWRGAIREVGQHVLGPIVGEQEVAAIPIASLDNVTPDRIVSGLGGVSTRWDNGLLLDQVRLNRSTEHFD